ncbi:MAG: hypothetical protein INF12_14770 [Methylobacterium sp.]|nr:hypothetical protein [Methylobacterium sp.]
MSLKTAIDTAIKRGASPVMISRLYGVSMASIEKRAAAIAERTRIARERRLRQIERECKFHEPAPAETIMRDKDERAIAAWLAYPISYENDPRSRPWNVGSAARNDAALARRREHFRSLGGVADYSSVPGEAA